MGFTDFHFGFGHPPPVEQYPHATVAYFRWPWAELEPVEGQYNFALVDRVIEQAKAKGETLAIRMVSEYKTGTPQWLLDKGVASVKESDGNLSDYNNPIFLDYHERLIRAFGERYGRSVDIDHVDIGSVDVGASGTPPVAEVSKHSAKHFIRLRPIRSRLRIGISSILPAPRS